MSGEIIQKNAVVQAFKVFSDKISKLNLLYKGNSQTFPADQKYGRCNGTSDGTTYNEDKNTLPGNSIDVVPNDDLIDKLNPKINTDNLSDCIKADDVKNAILAAANAYMNIRKIKMEWMHAVDTSGMTYNVFMHKYPDISSYATLQDTIPERATDVENITYNFGKVINNSKHIKGSLSDIDSEVSAGNIISVEGLNTYVSNLYDKWLETINDNVLTYTTYTCHWVCHSNWSSHRSRR